MKLYKLFFLLSLAVALFTGACKDKLTADLEERIATAIKVTHIDIPLVYNIVAQGDLKIDGRSFQADDIITFIPRNGQGSNIEFTIKELHEDHILLAYAEGLRDGDYEIRITRGTLNQLLGRSHVNHIFNANVPDIEGMTVKGTVYANGQGVANVVVSDGMEFAVTDQNGVYYLPSAKRNGYVFISVPSNYEVPVINTVPQFFKRLMRISSATEIRDFELFPVNNDNHVVAFMADIHLANRNSDIAQFQAGFKEDIKTTYEYYKGQNKRFYGLTLGDQTWEQYWFELNYGMSDYLNEISDLEFPIYNVIGNHDYHPYVAFNDWLGADEFRNLLGPTYYSMNIGQVHYIVLDNMIWVNNGGSQGIIGERNYNNTLDQTQLDWLEKDLSYISDRNTPIVVAMHVPMYRNPNASGNYTNYMTNSPALADLLANFSNVKVLTGHSHINYHIAASDNLSEHNIGAVSATWWWTGRPDYAGEHICKDGSPGGYALWEAEGRNQQWYYKSIGYERDYQFRAYDLNTVHITAAAHAPGANAEHQGMVPGIAGEYATPNNNNQVLLNIWRYQDNWTISVTENGTPLTPTRVSKKDPLHIISYDLQRVNVNATPTAAFASTNTAHMFLVTASSADSTLEIVVTDEFGNQYTERMERPKTFTYNMR